MKSNKTIRKFPIQEGQSIRCDFEESTWTFKMKEDFVWTGGKFKIACTEDFDKIKKVLDGLNEIESVCHMAGKITQKEYDVLTRCIETLAELTVA